MDITLEYAHPTTLVTTPTTTTLDVATNIHRPGVQFHGRVRDPLLFRQMLLAQHACILNTGDRDTWLDNDEWLETLDPVVTVYPDEIVFEVFSHEGGCYGLLTAPLSAFEIEGEVHPGTTNIDFSWDLREVLQGIRSSRQTYLTIGQSDATAARDSLGQNHFERRVSVPDRWLRSFLQMQGSQTASPFFITVHPVDLLNALTYLREHRTYRSPQGIRYEMQPDTSVKMILEPWDEVITLRDTHYTGFPRTVRVWGRKRLGVLQDVLPFAQRVTIGILGRGLPHIYTVHCGPFRLTIALSSWTPNDSSSNAFDLTAQQGPANEEHIRQLVALLGTHNGMRRNALLGATDLTTTELEQALLHLCRSGRALYDPATATIRLRDFLQEPVDTASLFPPDPRLAAAQMLLDTDQVHLQEGEKSYYGQKNIIAVIHDGVDYEVTCSLDNNGRIKYGRCGCSFFLANIMSRGPCSHILAARLAYDAHTEDVTAQDDDDDSDDEE